MRGAVSLLASAACVACLLAPNPTHAEISEYPNADLVYVDEIGDG